MQTNSAALLLSLEVLQRSLYSSSTQRLVQESSWKSTCTVSVLSTDYFLNFFCVVYFSIISRNCACVILTTSRTFVQLFWHFFDTLFMLWHGSTDHPRRKAWISLFTGIRFFHGDCYLVVLCFIPCDVGYVFFSFVEQNVAQFVLQCECRNVCCDSRIFIKIPL